MNNKNYTYSRSSENLTKQVLVDTKEDILFKQDNKFSILMNCAVSQWELIEKSNNNSSQSSNNNSNNYLNKSFKTNLFIYSLD